MKIQFYYLCLLLMMGACASVKVYTETPTNQEVSQAKSYAFVPVNTQELESGHCYPIPGNPVGAS